MYFDEGIADEEPDFTCGESVKFCKHTIYGKEKIRIIPDNGLVRGKYTKECVNPNVKDELCDPDWFLAAYWPVYVGNFRVLEWGEADGNQDAWRRQVADYFAFRGLMTRMIYFHQSDKEFLSYQRRSMLVDMLVYFVSNADALRAIRHCHGESYNGYKLIVLPGRKPVYFNQQRSVLFQNLKNQAQFTDAEFRIERTLSPFGVVELSSRRTHDSVIVQFGSVKSMVSAVSSQDKYKPYPVPNNTLKQRYLEEDVKMGILWTKESMGGNAFVDMKPRTALLQRLFVGKPPFVDLSWRGHTAPLVSPYHRDVQKQTRNRLKLISKKQRKEQRIKKWAKKLAANGEPKPDDSSPSVTAAPETSTEEPPKPVPASAEAIKSSGAAGGPVVARKSAAEVKADTLKAVNRFRKMHGMPRLFKNDMKRFAKQRRTATQAVATAGQKK